MDNLSVLSMPRCLGGLHENRESITLVCLFADTPFTRLIARKDTVAASHHVEVGIARI